MLRARSGRAPTRRREQGLEDVEEQQPAQSEPDGGREGDASLKVNAVVDVGLPGPAAGERFKKIAGGQFQCGGGEHAAQKHQQNPDCPESRRAGTGHQTAKAEEKYQGTYAVDRQ